MRFGDGSFPGNYLIYPRYVVAELTKRPLSMRSLGISWTYAECHRNSETVAPESNTTTTASGVYALYGVDSSSRREDQGME